MLYHPTLEEVKAQAGQGNLIPVYRSINADLETPVSAYLKVARPPYSFLLESVAGGERIGRYSFIGTEPYRVLKTGPGEEFGEVDPLTLVQAEMDQYRLIPVPGLPRFHGGGVGYLAYDTIHYFEPRVPSIPVDPLGLPESVFMFADTLLVFDHLRHDIKIVSHVRLDGDVEEAYREATSKIDELAQRLSQPLELPPDLMRESSLSGESAEVKSNFTRPQYKRAVEKCMEYVYAGDVIQVVNSQRYSRETGVHPFQIYRSLRGVNPSPYMYYSLLRAQGAVNTRGPPGIARVGVHVRRHPAGLRPSASRHKDCQPRSPGRRCGGGIPGGDVQNRRVGPAAVPTAGAAAGPDEGVLPLRRIGRGQI